MRPSKLRQEINRLNRERGKLLNRAMQPAKMVKGSLYQIGRTCGNPNCKCAKGYKHLSWYVSRAIEGKTKLTYIGRIAPSWLANRVKAYQHQQKLVARIRKADARISDCLKELREGMVETIEEAWKKRK